MYYISQNKSELEAYNTLVVIGEGYDGVYTTDWAKVIEHPNGTDYAVLKHENYTENISTLISLSSDWFPQLPEPIEE